MSRHSERRTPPHMDGGKYNPYEAWRRDNPDLDLGDLGMDLDNTEEPQQREPEQPTNADEARWVREWNRSAELRAEFGGRLQVWLCYCQAQANRQIKIMPAAPGLSRHAGEDFDK